jgi:hypothetical protein
MLRQPAVRTGTGAEGAAINSCESVLESVFNVTFAEKRSQHASVDSRIVYCILLFYQNFNTNVAVFPDHLKFIVYIICESMI